jgi:RHS repeat-associated protein
MSLTRIGVPVQNGGEPYGFTGEWWEADVSLLYLRARWLMPETGTFLSVDPVESEPPYAYVGGNVVNRVDPSGHFSNETISNMFGKEDFKDVLTLFETNQRWGLLKLLQDANMGDRVIAGHPLLGSPNSSEILVGAGYGTDYGVFGCRWDDQIILKDGPRGFYYDMDLLLSTIELGLYGNITKPPLHRRIDYYLYYLNGNGPQDVLAPAYADFIGNPDLPDFGFVDIAVPFFSKSEVVDRYGNTYRIINLAGGFGSPVDVGMYEAYLYPLDGWIYQPRPTARSWGDIPAETSLKAFLTPALSSEMTFSGGFLGWGAGFINNSNSIAILYGGQLASIGGDLTLGGWVLGKDPNISWDWIGRIDKSISKANIHPQNDNEQTECLCNKK